jgi:hypothetical protein
MSTTTDAFAPLLEPMTAKEFLCRFDPPLLKTFVDTETALQEITANAAAIIAEYGPAPSPSGTYPRVVWDMAFYWVPAYRARPAGFL